jgi:hypothetical protein
VSPREVIASLLLALPLWVAGTVVFDAVHWVLHRMLRSRWRVLRALAWPHAVHHAWLDRRLRVCREHQLGNVFCHLVPEYLTQLAFSGVLLLALPSGPVLALAGLQTAVFLYLLAQKGLDVNHRPVEILDAYRPSVVCPPAYHALHHVYPDAYFSAYTKLVDWLVGGGAWLAGRRYALAGGDRALGCALREALEREGAGEIVEIASPAEAARRDLDVLLLCDPGKSDVPFAEAFVAATRDRQLPPEVWSVLERPDDATARHYLRDVRVSYRAIVAPGHASLDAASARRAARSALFWLRRGMHWIPTRIGAGTWRDYRRFRRARPERPAGLPLVRSRAELAAG